MRKTLFAGIVLTVLLAASIPMLCSETTEAEVYEAEIQDADGLFLHVTYVFESAPDGFKAPQDTMVLRGQVVPTGSDVDGYTKSILVNGVQSDGPIIAGDEDMEICIAFSQDLDHMVVPCLVLIGVGVIINIAAVFCRRSA